MRRRPSALARIRTRGDERPAGDVRAVQRLTARSPATPATFIDPAANPAIAAALQEMARTYEAAWLDEPIPALAGHTPRECANDPTRRPDLIRLLDSFPQDTWSACRPRDVAGRRRPPCTYRAVQVTGVEVADLELDHNEAAQPQVVEQQVGVEVGVTDFEVNLAPDEREALAEFEQELFDVVSQCAVRGRVHAGCRHCR